MTDLLHLEDQDIYLFERIRQYWKDKCNRVQCKQRNSSNDCHPLHTISWFSIEAQKRVRFEKRNCKISDSFDRWNRVGWKNECIFTRCCASLHNWIWNKWYFQSITLNALYVQTYCAFLCSTFSIIFLWLLSTDTDMWHKS